MQQHKRNVGFCCHQIDPDAITRDVMLLHLRLLLAVERDLNQSRTNLDSVFTGSSCAFFCGCDLTADVMSSRSCYRVNGSYDGPILEGLFSFVFVILTDFLPYSSRDGSCLMSQSTVFRAMQGESEGLRTIFVVVVDIYFK
jgi:hypothetical protein